MRRTLILLALAVALSGCGGSDEAYKTEGGSPTLLDGSPAPKDAVPIARVSPRERRARWVVGYLLAPADDTPRLCSRLDEYADCRTAPSRLLIDGRLGVGAIERSTVLRHGCCATGYWSPRPVALRGYVTGPWLTVTSTIRAAPRKPGTPSGYRLHLFLGPSDRRDVSLDQLVPPKGRLTSVWREPGPAGRIAVAWSFRGRWSPYWNDTHRYALTVWRRDHVNGGSARWTPQTIVRASPFPLSNYSARWVDATGDGKNDLLVTIACLGCNHGTQIESIYGTFAGRLRHIYGSRYFGVGKDETSGPGVRGRVDSETFWGVTDAGLVYFDVGGLVSAEPRRNQTFLRWTGRGWRTVARRNIPATKDTLLRQAVWR